VGSEAPDVSDDSGPEEQGGREAEVRAPPRRSGTKWRVVRLHAAVIGSFLVVSVFMWSRVWLTGHPRSTLSCQCGDVSEALGFVAWAPWALTHGHNLFFSNAFYAGQGGVNMVANASWMAFALLFAPITWLFGPIATVNVAVTLAPVVSGWCFFLAVRKVTQFVPGQIAGAALYGFSPLIVTSDPLAHFFQIWLFYPPLAFLCLYDLFVTRRHRPVLVGVALGLLTVVQFFTSTEVLVISCLIGLIGVVAAFVFAPRAAWARRRPIAVGVGTAVGIAGALLAYPTWFALEGPQRIVGAAWPATPALGAGPRDLIDPGKFVHHPDLLTALGGYFGNAGPTASYVGIAVLALVVISVVVWYRDRLAWVIVVMGLASWACSLGSLLRPLSSSSNQAWLPWRFFQHVPVVSDVIPSRFAATTVFCVALLLAVSADRWWQRARAFSERQRAKSRPTPALLQPRALGVAIACVTAAALIPVGAAYSVPYVVRNHPMPRWFQDVAPKLPAGTEVLAYPYPDGGENQAMGWQAIDDLHFRLVGGFAIVPGKDGQHSSAVSRFGGARSILYQLSFSVGLRHAAPLPLATPEAVRMVRASLHKWGTQVVVVTHEGRSPRYALAYFTAVLGRTPRFQDGAWVWYGLGRDPPLSLDPAATTACAAQYSRTDRLGVPRCVLAAAQSGPHPSA
jgi:hypothetical protein